MLLVMFCYFQFTISSIFLISIYCTVVAAHAMLLANEGGGGDATGDQSSNNYL